MASAFGHVAMRTRFQDWTRVRILMSPVATGHWTQAGPFYRIHCCLAIFLGVVMNSKAKSYKQ